ncbi:unnamed protein product [Caenorhabditis brenneri]
MDSGFWIFCTLEGFLIGVLIITCIYAILKYLAQRRSKQTTEVKKTPMIPFSQEGLYEYKGDDHKKHVIPDVRILCSPIFKSYCTSSKLNKFMIDLFKLRIHEDDGTSTRHGKKCPLPMNARVISIKMNGFKHGKELHEFEPIDGAAPGSSYEFQMLGDQKIQATYYVEGGVSYPAGYCIYLSKTGLRDEEFPLDVIRESSFLAAQMYLWRMRRMSQVASAPMEEDDGSRGGRLCEGLEMERQDPPPPYASTIHIV